MPEIELRSARPAEFDAIGGLLSAAELPVEDLNVTMLDAYVVATEGEVCVGVVGLEIHESNALLRSLAVEPRHRSRGLGARLVDAIETEAQARGVTAVYLLTTTATTFFERVGYTAHDRATVPPSMRRHHRVLVTLPRHRRLPVARPHDVTRCWTAPG